MELQGRKQVREILLDFETHPEKYNGSPMKELLMERKNLADKERIIVDEIEEFQKQIQEQMMKKSTEVMKLQGAVEYIENKILELKTSS